MSTNNTTNNTNQNKKHDVCPVFLSEKNFISGKIGGHIVLERISSSLSHRDSDGDQVVQVGRLIVALREIVSRMPHETCFGFIASLCVLELV